jgi:hypothetical protein
VSAGPSQDEIIHSQRRFFGKALSTLGIKLANQCLLNSQPPSRSLRIGMTRSEFVEYLIQLKISNTKDRDLDNRTSDR